MPSVITFDLFSALTDSRTGGASVFATWARRRRWALTGEELYDVWDRLNKEAQGRQAPADTGHWVSYVELATRALDRAYRELGLEADAAADAAALTHSQQEWPLWPDTTDGLRRIATARSIGILSNVDDALVGRTRAVGFFADELVFTSERLRAYKPHPLIYERARDACRGDLIHVATSARDVRGALEAGIEVVRLRRPGHRLDPEGPSPQHEVSSMAELTVLLESLS